MRINAIGFRLLANNNWLSQWFSSEKSNYAKLSSQDIKIRTFIEGLFGQHGFIIGEVRIGRNYLHNEVMVNVEVATQSNLASKEYDNLLKDCQQALVKLEGCNGIVKVWMTLLNANNLSMSATLLANFIVFSLDKHKFLPIVEKELKTLIPRLSIAGIRVEFAGRFSRKGRRSKKRLIQFGIVPTQSIRANVEYCGTYAVTRYGSIGIKVWLHKIIHVKNSKTNQI